MRRQLAVLALCVTLLCTGCAGVQFDIGDPTASSSPPSAEPANGTFQAHYLNVGQADATLLRTDNETMLIDTGHWNDDGETVLAYLESRGVDRIDHLVTTHPHSDHVGGHAAVIEHYETEKGGIGAIYDSGVPHTTQTYDDYLDAVEQHNVSLFEVAQDDEIPFEGARATVLNPETPGGDDIDNGGVAVRIQFGSTSFLFTGDAGREAETRMVEAHGAGLRADVYQAGHHGSDTSSSDEFLDAVDPELAVVSSAHDSDYGHPHDEPLDRLAERDVRVLWTGAHGTTVLESDGETLTVRTQHDATTDPLEIQGAEAATAAPTDPTERRFSIDLSDGTAQTTEPTPEGATP